MIAVGRPGHAINDVGRGTHVALHFGLIAQNDAPRTVPQALGEGGQLRQGHLRYSCSVATVLGSHGDRTFLSLWLGRAVGGSDLRCGRSGSCRNLGNSFPYRDDVGASSRLGAVPRPRIHQLAPFVEEIAALVGCFGLVAFGMRQSRFSDFGRKRSLLGSPISKCRAETVYDRISVLLWVNPSRATCCLVSVVHAPEQHLNCHVAEWSVRTVPWKDIS